MTSSRSASWSSPIEDQAGVLFRVEDLRREMGAAGDLDGALEVGTAVLGATAHGRGHERVEDPR
jgi:hypothetical protein